MKYTQTSLPKSQREFTIEISVEEMETFLRKAANTLSQKATMDGFRPGHIPYEVLKQRLGEMEIYQEAANLAIHTGMEEVVEKEKLEFASEPHITVQKSAPGNEFIFTAVFDLLPKIILPNLEALPKISRKKIEIPDAEIQKTMEELQKLHRKETLKNDPVARNDKVEIDFDILRNNVLIENGHFEKYPVIIGENIMINGFEDELIGLKAGEKKSFELTFPKPYHRKDLEGTKTLFNVTVRAVYQLETPKLDDAFAQTLGKFETLQQLKDQIRDNLTLESLNREEQRFHQELLERVVRASNIPELPDSLVEKEAQNIVSETKKFILEQHLRWEDYLTHLKKSEDELKQGSQKQAIARLHTSLVARALAREYQLSLSEQDMASEISEMLSANADKPELTEKIRSPHYRRHVEMVLTNRKVLEFLKKKLESPNA